MKEEEDLSVKINTADEGKATRATEEWAGGAEQSLLRRRGQMTASGRVTAAGQIPAPEDTATARALPPVNVVLHQKLLCRCDRGQDLELGDDLGLPGWALHPITGVLARGRPRGISGRGKGGDSTGGATSRGVPAACPRLASRMERGQICNFNPLHGGLGEQP